MTNNDIHIEKEKQEEQERLLAQKEKGKTLIIASHNREDIDVLCDHVWEMDKGIATKVR